MSPKIAIWAPSHNFDALYLRNQGTYRKPCQILRRSVKPLPRYGDSSFYPCQISPPSVQRQGCRTPKIEIFTQIWPKCGI